MVPGRGVVELVIYMYTPFIYPYIPLAAQCSGRVVLQVVLSPFVSWDLYSGHSWTWQRVRSPGSQGEHS